MPDWRFLILDTKTLTPQAELPALEVRFSETLNSPGTAEVVIPLDAPGLTKEMLSPPDAILMVERDEVPLWAGPVWTWDMDVAQATLRLAAEGYLSFLRRRLIHHDRDYYAEAAWTGEQIAGDLVQYTQSTYGTFSINNRTGTSSTTFRDRHYKAQERKPVGEAIEQLASVRGGFDFRFQPRWVGPGYATIDFITTYPPTGRQTEIVLELGATADIIGATLDGTHLAYNVVAIGQGMGDDIPTSIQSDPGLASAHVDLHASVSYSDVSQVSTLTGYALERLAQGRAPVVIPRVSVDPSMLGEFVVGDRVYVKGEMGLLSINDWYRITSYEASLSDTADDLTLTLAPMELYA